MQEEMSPRLTRFCDFYSNFEASRIDTLHELYTESVIFKDPIHQITGIENMQNYLADLCRQVTQCSFVFEQCMEAEDRAFLRWAMHYAHPKIAAGESLQLDGLTEIEFLGDRVCYHCDYYDMGAMLYEHLPVVGGLVRWLRNRLS